MSVKRVTVHVAKTQLSRLIQAAENGDEVVIARRDVPVVRLVAISKRQRQRKFGAMKGRARVDDCFFEPLPKDELARWEA
jgi:prevent-host-death family protein